MAVSSEMLALGTPMPAFSLPDTVTSRIVSSTELGGKPSVVVFLCNHCPYVKRIREGLAAFGRSCSELGVPVVAISSNDPTTYPDDAPDKMKLEAQEAGYPFPYLFDESQAVARAFRAACTPDLYIFDRDGKLAYRGQFDDARPKNDVPVTGADARRAVEALIAGKAPSSDQKPSIGCNIKWKPGNAPA
ncbi:MAG TPA: thioredoxin family protein [Polyangiaceae bacterium]|nr:thioredoxin family protein [Polyangiaceae bacterium]